MMRALPAVAIAAVSMCLALATSAHAEPDPHVPDPGNRHCPGGGAGSAISTADCDGLPYRDGSYWHDIQYGIPLISHPGGLLGPGLPCAVNNGSPAPALAPPGGCTVAV